ncbi:MAG: hypothetical protein FJX35_28410 [Alphaproteobacteria bacterium]|nr:hypothetical protein [Alphaproteobacteria bacterium]
MVHYLSVCAIFKNEASYLEEWLTFYELIGVDHFYLYNNNSDDDFASVLAPWVARGRVTLTGWPQHPGQLKAYGHCIINRRRESRWIMFVDLDEFLFSPTEQMLPKILAGYERSVGVGANWVMFGSSGHQTRPPGLVTLNYTRRAGLAFKAAEPELLLPGGKPDNIRHYRPISTHIKSIVDPRQVIQVASPHSFGFAGGALAVDERWQPITGTPLNAFTAAPSIEVLRVNHYFAKSLEEYTAKLTRPRADSGTSYPVRWFLEREKRSNELVDETILPIARQVAAKLGV